MTVTARVIVIGTETGTTVTGTVSVSATVTGTVAERTMDARGTTRMTHTMTLVLRGGIKICCSWMFFAYHTCHSLLVGI